MTLSNLLTLRVDFRDEQAAARITPEQANAYLAARGWQRVDRRVWHVWNIGEEQAKVPRERLSDRWFLVTTSREIVRPGELPEGWGWLVVQGGRMYAITAAPKLEPEPISRPFLAALLRRADEAPGAFAPTEIDTPEAQEDRLRFGGVS